MLRAATCIVTLGFFGGFSPVEVQVKKELIKKLEQVAQPKCPNDRDLLVNRIKGNSHTKFDGEDKNKKVSRQTEQQDELPVTNDSQGEENYTVFFEGQIKNFDLRGLGLSDLTEMELQLLLTVITSTTTLAIFDLRENGFNFNDTKSTLAMRMAEAEFTMVYGKLEPSGEYTSFNKWKRGTKDHDKPLDTQKQL
jgi:hypothetical protein